MVFNVFYGMKYQDDAVTLKCFIQALWRQVVGGRKKEEDKIWDDKDEC